MTEIVISNTAADGEVLEARFLPSKGMNMQSYKKGSTEVLDLQTQNLFDERYAGLGALIGPHFHRRHPGIIPAVPSEEKFPHIARIKASGAVDPFSHGIGRYAPWKVESTAHGLRAELTGDDEWNGIALKDLQGQNFKMKFSADMLPSGLRLDLSVVSDSDSLVGTHYYFRLPEGKGTVHAEVQPQYRESGEMKPVPETWFPKQARNLELALDKDHATDFGFRSYPSTLGGKIRLETAEYTLTTDYESTSAENSWQLYHPEGASFVCIEPMSALDPSKPRLSVSSLQIHLGIETHAS